MKGGEKKRDEVEIAAAAAAVVVVPIIAVLLNTPESRPPIPLHKLTANSARPRRFNSNIRIFLFEFFLIIFKDGHKCHNLVKWHF